MSTPTTATATLLPHYRHHHHSTHHYPPYPNLQSSTSTYRSVAGAASSTNPILPTSTSTASTATGSNRHHASSNHSSSSYTTNSSYATSQTLQNSTNGVTASVATARPTQDSSRTNSTPRLDANSVNGNNNNNNSTMPPSTASSATQAFSDGQPRKRRRSKEPDWKNFYKNGLPKEVIVIHDDTPEPDSKYSATSSRTYVNGVNDSNGRPANKRRRKDDGVRAEDTYDGSVNGSTYQQTSDSGSTSTDRTTSAHNTTAATSLGSLSSNGQYDYESSHAGQKRKRTRQQIAQEAKRREVEVLGDAFVSYRPPQKPVKKSGDVTVRVVNDRSHQSGVRVDDDDGHYIVVPDADLTSQYQMIKLLGQGTFGKVVQARDRKKGGLVAIKIIRAVQKYRDASRIELRVLQTLKANDEENRNRCIHLRDCFDFRGHICIVMDLLGSSVFDFLKSNNFVPFPNSQIQSFARQLFTSVAFLHDLNLIHTDLKPENILLCDSAYQTFTYNRRIPSSSTGVSRQATQRKVLLDTEIRLIDFGSATFQDEYHSSVVSTRHYRAPEIILGLGWSYPCDIWSIGCILVEFFTGDALFQTHDNLEHLAMMENVCDARIDTHLVQTVNKMNNRNAGNAASKYFKRLKLDYPTAETTRASRRFVKNMKRLPDIIPSSSPFLRSFLDLLQKIFVYDPSKRITARQALEHEWFREPAIPDDGTEAAKIRLERMRDHEYPASRGLAVG
ncbi:kinase-like domain-containing protein [Hypoxylon trugodes]|uniref:kinase-like domain-containing protein n=1 Tax=Hypoxylon trugodes TaxID=326681 RepID=UPI002193E3EB|nr:kinase-like domain-containing protein [Hypoxylon trugodes]KAI1393619.1 kinase-like domain-containing protein [Hypoxylon trugodes]